MTRLEAACEALREETARAPAESSRTLRLVVTHRRNRNSRRLLFLGLLLSASAAAAWTSVREAHWWGLDDLSSARLTRSSPSPVIAAPIAVLHSEATPPAPPTSAAQLPLSPFTQTAVLTPSRVAVRERRQPPAANGASNDLEDDLFEKAQRTHRENPSSPEELAVWESYLQRYPQGRFVPEASFRRAVTLANLGKTIQARSALQPFASGEFGNYRRQDAARWLQTLDVDP